MFLYFSIYLFILIFFLRSTHQSAGIPWFLCSPELLLVQFLLFSPYCLSFPSFNLPSCFFHIFSPPAAKVAFFCFCFAFYFCLFLSVISPFLLILFFPFFPFTSPSLHCLLPLVNGSPPLYQCSLFLVARETNRQCNRCQFCIQLPA